MTTLIQEIVTPAQIESTLTKIWEGLAKERRIRASLFNLILFHRLSPRTDYLRYIVQKILEKFPCRVLFISHDLNPKEEYLKTAVSVLSPGQGDTACDQIDVGVTTGRLERVPSLLLPHLIPDLPTYLVWGEDPTRPDPLFDALKPLASRLIFDSESASSLALFARQLLPLYPHHDIADLNWVRTLGWRDLFSTVFDSPPRIDTLKQLKTLTLTYNSRTTDTFCHPQIQAIYLSSWLHSRLHTPFETKLETGASDTVNPGYLLNIELKFQDGSQIRFVRNPEHPTQISIETPELCSLFLLSHDPPDPSLVHEIIADGTSHHFLETLKSLPSTC